MADLLIRDVAMPKDRNTTLIIYCDGTINLRVQMKNGEHLIPITAKAVSLPEGHGRLGDLDALFKKMYRLSDNEGAHKDSRVDDALILRDSACYLIEDAPTIVPAEGGGEDG